MARRREHDVLGLHVAVHEPVLVRVTQRHPDLARGHERFVLAEGARALDPRLQTLPVHEIHRVEVALARGIVTELDAADDVRVVEPAGHFDLALETRDELGRRLGGGQHLDRESLLGPSLAGLVYVAHRARADLFDDLVAADDA